MYLVLPTVIFKTKIMHYFKTISRELQENETGQSRFFRPIRPFRVKIEIWQILIKRSAWSTYRNTALAGLHLLKFPDFLPKLAFFWNFSPFLATKCANDFYTKNQ